jgi:3',5'-cyclic AMP phosphodiesterase CpdA
MLSKDSKMRSLVLSDLHVDKTGGDVPELRAVDADCVLFAGDLNDGAHLAMRWLADRLTGLPIYAVLGNHDVWRDGSAPGYTIEEQYERCKEYGAKLGITVIEREATYVGDVRILGTTLWTDFECRPPTMSLKQAMYFSQNGYLPGDGNYRGERDRMNDYKFTHQIDPDGRRRRFTPARSIEIHKESVAWLEAQLATPHDGPTLVMTHHAPSPKSLMPGWHNHDWCYASDLESLMIGDGAPEVWLHGHIHRSRDYCVGETRVIANPRGYPTRQRGVMENPGWDPALVIDIEPRPKLRMRI